MKKMKIKKPRKLNKLRIMSKNKKKPKNLF